MKKWLRSFWEARSSPDPMSREVAPLYPLAPVVEALSRQRALAEQRLRRPTEDRQLEQGRRMACIEVAKELGIHDNVTSRTYELRRR